ncbi:MAG: hypothetical protein WBA59_00665 [Moheibacter sp.]
MAENSEKSTSQEIDLFSIMKRIGNSFDRLGLSIYRFINFLIRNILIILGLIVVGFVIGYFIDNNKEPKYSHKIVVAPNFGSLENLYNEVDNMNLSKTPISSMEIEPIIDIYEFSKDRWSNGELLKTLYTNNYFIDKYKPGSNVERFYRYHLLTIVTNRKDIGNKIIDSLLNNFNKGEYFLERQKVERLNREKEITELESSVSLINGILEKLGSSEIPSSNLNVEMYSDLNSIIGSKKNIVEEISRSKVIQIEQSKTIFDVSRVTNIKENQISKKIQIPILLFVLFLFFSSFKRLFIRYHKIDRA